MVPTYGYANIAPKGLINMNHKKLIWISISLIAVLLMLFSIILLNYFDKSVDNNDCVETTLEESNNDSIGTTLEESENDQKKTINIPEHISNILSKEHMILLAFTFSREKNK